MQFAASFIFVAGCINYKCRKWIETKKKGTCIGKSKNKKLKYRIIAQHCNVNDCFIPYSMPLCECTAYR